MITDDNKAFFEQVNNDYNLLIKTIEEELEDANVVDLPLIILSPDDDDSEEPRIEAGRPKHPYFEKMLAPFKSKIRDLVCDKGDYCKSKAKYKDEITLMVTVFDAISSASLVLPLPLATVSAYCVTSLYLDGLCECNC